MSTIGAMLISSSFSSGSENSFMVEFGRDRGELPRAHGVQETAHVVAHLGHGLGEVVFKIEIEDP